MNHYKLFFLHFTFYILFTSNLQAQISTDVVTQQLVVKALDDIYNQEFKEAEAGMKLIKAKYPDHPVNSLLKAMQWQWQYLPVKDNKSMAGAYLKLLNDCKQQAKILEKDKATQPEAAFFSMAGHGYTGLVHNHNNDHLKAAGEAKSAYNYLLDGMDLVSKNAEFYFSTGMYNYYVVQYPNEHPIIKPITFFFRNGNKALGLKQIDIGTKKGLFTRTEAAFFISRIYLKHEAQPEKALPYMESLVKKYPNNMVFAMKYIETLTSAGQYAEAEKALNVFKTKADRFYLTAATIFEGLLLEKHDKKDNVAALAYQKALKMPFDDEFTKQYRWFATAGLARIAARAKQQNRAMTLYRQVKSESEYLHLKREAEAFLK